MDVDRSFLIIGSGNAGVSAARELIERGARKVTLLTADPHLPYDRTTLSKPFDAVPESAKPLWGPDDAWASHLTLHLRTQVSRIDRGTHTVTTATGDAFPYDALLLATGAEPRRLDLDGANGPDVLYLRNLDDARVMRGEFVHGRRLAIIGGGVIGLEVAATASSLGLHVEVIEAAPRLLQRGIPAPVADFLAALHEANGVRFHIGVAPSAFVRRPDGHLAAVELADGSRIAADIAVVGIGVRPRDGLARDAGLDVDDGIVVGSDLRTSDPTIFAAGDAARMRGDDGGRGVRLENWYPAGHQGQVAAKSMLGDVANYTEAPWTWSDQYDAMLQTAGLQRPGATQVVLGDGERLLLVIEHLDGDVVSAVGVGRGPGIGKPIKAVQRIIEQRASVAVDALDACAPDLAAATQLLVAATQSAATAS